MVGYKVTLRVVKSNEAKEYVIHVGTDGGFAGAIDVAKLGFDKWAKVDRCVVDRQEEAPNG